MAGRSVPQNFAELDDDGVASPASAHHTNETAQLMEEGNSPTKRNSQDSPLLGPTMLDTANEATNVEGEGGDGDLNNTATSRDFTMSNKTKIKLLMASGVLLLLGVSTRILTGIPGNGGVVTSHGARERIEEVQVGTGQDGDATSGVVGVGNLADRSDSLAAPLALPSRGPVVESAKPLLTESLQPPKSAELPVELQEASFQVAPARAALGIQGLQEGLQSLKVPNLQGLLDAVSSDGDDSDSDYDCQADVANSMMWTPDKQLYCCNMAGVGCAQQDDTSAMGGDDTTDDIDELLQPGNPHIYKPMVSDDGSFQSGVPLCDIGVDSCPKDWWTGPTGGFFCPEEAEDKQCRPLADGPWDPQQCKSQCSIGNTPITTTITATSTTVTRTYVGMSIKLLCWSLCAAPYEIDIARFQMQRNAGIFDCDETMVLTFWPEVLDAGALGRLNTVVIPRENVGRSKDGTAGNALQFMKAWDAVAHDGRWNQVDWVLKVDPDAVLLPDRIRMHLNPYQGWKVYVRNCDKPMSEGAMMFGALEAISVPGLQVYFNSGGRCFHEIPWQAWGEDLFMMRCLEHLGVGPVGDFQLIQDGVCKGVWCGSNWAAAFHPMKSVWAWENCWHQAIASR